MKRKNLILLVFILLVTTAFTETHPHLVDYVYDGDTIRIETGQRVRYAGINAPEIGHRGVKSEFLANTAKAFNTRLVRNNRVTLSFDREKEDRYGRLLAYVHLETGDMVNAILVGEGLAHVLATPPNLKYFNRLRDLQRKAIQKGLGIWQQAAKDPERFYAASKRSFRFHRPSCSFGKSIGSINFLKFKNRRNAFWNGFSPCSRCRP